MSRILSIPDVHGSHKWEVVKNLSAQNYDYIVFHGDYFDCWENEWPDQGENFKNICTFVREDTNHHKLLLGNHDWSYLTGTGTDSCSGHQGGRALEIRNLLKQNLDIIDIAFECDGWVFSHAGFSSTWVNAMRKIFHNIFDKDGYEWREEDFSVDFLNRQFHKFGHSSDEKDFHYEFDELLDWYGFFSGSGDEVTQGPLWIRPTSLLEDAYYKNQVVGHTELCLYDKVYLQKNDNKVIIVDSSIHEVYDVFDTNAEYDFLTIKEYCKLYKQTLKVINDIKSQIFYHKDAEEFVRQSLKKHFTDDVVARLVRNAFGDYLGK